MRFFLDENFPRPAITFLETAGHSASHALQNFSPGFKRHSGAIVITLRKPNRADLLRRLADALALVGDRDMHDAVCLVTEACVRSRKAQ